MSAVQSSCPVCQKPATVEVVAQYVVRVDCARCTRFRMSWSLYEYWEAVRTGNSGKLESESEKLLPYLAAHIRRSPEEVAFGFDGQNWMEAARARMATPVSQKVARLLETLAMRSSSVGALVPYNLDELAPLVDASGAAEIEFLLWHLRDAGDIELEEIRVEGSRDGLGGFSESEPAALLTVQGWSKVAPRVGGAIPGTCFVAMAFHQDLDEAYLQGFDPAITATGLRVVRVDKIEHNGIVTDLIMAEITRAEVIVADVTLQRPGVYFEAGFASGLGRVVIWCCRKDEIDQVHFDTRQYSHVVWTDPSDLRQKLEARIRATVQIRIGDSQ